jgi:non-specific serine/threonine protein kinase/serine/threonine-protein kinase
MIHRDLKPSNILVTEVDGAATPKVIDFGIAKAIHQPLTDAMLVTNRMELLGTPQYMSPEQADADERAIDTRTDVYSLGVVLYELLTGTTPLEEHSLRSASYARMFRLILEQRIERPSARLIKMGGPANESTRWPDTDVKSLSRRLRGDLDWIVLKALSFERNRRYESAVALAQDIRRSLNHEPVEAGPPSTVYRIRKFARRHRIGVTASALITLAMIGGIVGTTIGMWRATEARDRKDVEARKAQRVAEFSQQMLAGIDPAFARGNDTRLLRKILCILQRWIRKRAAFCTATSAPHRQIHFLCDNFAAVIALASEGVIGFNLKLSSGTYSAESGFPGIGI